MTGAANYGPIGLDIHDHLVCAVQFRRGRGGPNLHAWGSVTVDSAGESGDGAKTVMAALLQLRDAVDFKGNRVYAAIPSIHVDARPIRIPGWDITAGNSRPSAEQLTPFLPYPLDAAVYDFLNLPATPGAEATAPHGLLVSTRKEIANRSLAMLRAVKFSCEELDIRATSISRALRPRVRFDCLVELGWNLTEMVLRRDGDVILNRTLRRGMSTLLGAIASELNVDTDTAARFLRRYDLGVNQKRPCGDLSKVTTDGNFSQEDLSGLLFTIIEPELRALSEQIEQTLLYARTHQYTPGVERVLLMGELLPGKLTSYLSYRLECPVVQVDGPTELPPWAASGEIPLARFAAAAGLALRGMDT